VIAVCHRLVVTSSQSEIHSLVLNDADGGGPAAPAPQKTGGVHARKTMTIAQLKQELTAAGYAAEILAVKNISKKELLKLYEDKGLAG
jgi:hypothetical protein